MHLIREATVAPNDTLAQVRLSVVMVTMITGAVMPLLVGLVTNIRDSSFVKGVLQLVLNTVSAFILQATMIDGSVAFSKQTAVVALVGMITSMVAYYNVWKAKGITSSAFMKLVSNPQEGSEKQVLARGKLSDTGLRPAA